MAHQWTSIRRVGHQALTTDLFAFLTTEPNAEVREVQKSMPVILRCQSARNIDPLSASNIDPLIAMMS